MSSCGRRLSSLSHVDALVWDSAFSAVHAPPRSPRRSRTLIHHQAFDSPVLHPPAPPSEISAHVAHGRLESAYRQRRPDTRTSDVYPIKLPSATTISAVLHRYHRPRQARPPAVIPAAAFPPPPAQLSPCCSTIARHPRLPALPKNKLALTPLLRSVQAGAVSLPSRAGEDAAAVSIVAVAAVAPAADAPVLPPPPPLHPNNP